MKKTILDFATTITIIGILLYYLGWVYWSNYLENFGIQLSFVEISPEKIIVTTWPFMLLTLLNFGISFTHILESKEEKLDALQSIIIAGLCVILCLWGIFQNMTLQTIVFVYVFLAIILSIIRMKWKINIGNIAKKNFQISMFFLVYILSIVFSYSYSDRKAKEILENYQNNIEVTFTDKEKLTGKFIIIMNDNVFLLFENKNCKRDLIIINNSEIRSQKFFN